MNAHVRISDDPGIYCENCRFSELLPQTEAGQPTLFTCHRYPPAVLLDGTWLWPEVTPTERCGEWKPEGGFP